jgi:hypothetical protein
MNRRQFVGYLGSGAAAVALGGVSLELEGCTPTSVIAEVLKLLPTIGSIVKTVGTVIAGIDPGIALPVGAALAIIESAFTIVQNILTQYEANLGNIPQTILAALDAALASITSQISAIEALFPGLPAAVTAGINVALAAFQTILTLIASLLPAPVAATMFPRSYASLSARHVQFGATVQVPTPRQWAQSYNSKMSASGWPEKKCHIRVPLF